jgi:Immunity protein Imm5
MYKRGELPSGNRKNIYKAIEKFSTKEYKDVGYHRIAKLKLSCALKTLDKWNTSKLTDNSAKELLELAENYLKSQIKIEELKKRKECFFTQVEDLMDKGSQHFVAAYAGFACISAVNTVSNELNMSTMFTAGGLLSLSMAKRKVISK